jgi:hypothetical protein
MEYANMNLQLQLVSGVLHFPKLGGGTITTYEAINVALQSNSVLIGVFSIIIMLFVANKKK